ncbi:MAG: amidohydrolase [Bacteroidota bacterium]
MKDIIPEIIAFRRHLHQNPELSNNERETSSYIKQHIEKCEPDQIIEFNNYGLAIIFKGRNAGKRLLIRGDMDALPIQEINEIEYKSRKDGVSHKCGHDGHSSILYGLARKYAENRPEYGDAVLLFQPAEETGDGAKGVLADHKFSDLKPDFTVALHNLPGFAKHQIVYRRGIFTAAANSMIIKYYGKTSHAGQPELGKNPALAIAEVTKKYDEKCIPDIERDDFQIITPIYYTMGHKSYGVSAGYAETHFTLRAWQNEIMEKLEKECVRIAKEIGDKYGLVIEIDWTQSFFANQNNDEVVDAIVKSAKRLNLDLEEKSTPFRWGEDFGLFTTEFPGAMYGLGAGTNIPALHNPDYDFPDEILETGINMMAEIQKELANK